MTAVLELRVHWALKLHTARKYRLDPHTPHFLRAFHMMTSCLLWPSYVYCGHHMSTVAIICLLWPSYVYCGHHMSTVAIICSIVASYPAAAYAAPVTPCPMPSVYTCNFVNAQSNMRCLRPHTHSIAARACPCTAFTDSDHCHVTCITHTVQEHIHLRSSHSTPCGESADTRVPATSATYLNRTHCSKTATCWQSNAAKHRCCTAMTLTPAHATQACSRMHPLLL
jgi:hypothetical protein